MNYGLSFCELKATNQFSFIFFSVFLTQGNAFCKRVFIFNGFFNEFFSQAINNAINYRQLVLKCTAGLLILTPSYWLAANPAWCLAEKGRTQPAAARKQDGEGGGLE